MVGDEDFRVNGWANYIGPSRLGIGPVLGESQGDYVNTGLAMRVGNDRRGLSLTLTNLFDSRGNRFSLGTPFLEGNQGFLTPLRPRTLRIAVDVAYCGQFPPCAAGMGRWQPEGLTEGSLARSEEHTSELQSLMRN